MDLLLSLGHNSSAIGIDEDGKIIAGYEEERFSRKKSDSNFPTQSILNIFEVAQEQGNIEKAGTVYLTHWYDNFDFIDNHDNSFHPTYSRHINWEMYFDFMKAGFKIVRLDKDFTHHDAHAWSAISFLRNHADKKLLEDYSSHIFVCDGFGNKQETFSVYRANFSGNKKPSMFPIFKVRGYELSMGLMYQFATSFMGMKENKDEYKILGYESYIRKCDTIFEDQIDFLEQHAHIKARELFDKALENWKNNYIPDSDDNFINIKRLTEVKKEWYEHFRKTLNQAMITPETHGDFSNKVALSFYVQSVLEEFHSLIIDHHATDNLMLAGGVYYNVKLNNQILKKIPGKLCIMPLAGDQGCGIGFYEYMNYGKLEFDSLLIGRRKLDYVEESESEIKFEKIKQEEKAIDDIVDRIFDDEIVNLVNGPMEFGPRALCDTSTLFLAKDYMAKINNVVNDRNEVMPVCPVMLEENAEFFFNKSDIDRIIGSLYYMIIAIDYSEEFLNSKERRNYDGVLHNYPLSINSYTGRPQLVNEKKNPFMYKILRKLNDKGIKAITNTSFNYHGKTIVLSFEHAIEDMSLNLKQKQEKKISNNINLFIGSDL